MVTLNELLDARLELDVGGAELQLDLAEDVVVVLHTQQNVPFVRELLVVGGLLKPFDGFFEPAAVEVRRTFPHDVQLGYEDEVGSGVAHCIDKGVVIVHDRSLAHLHHDVQDAHQFQNARSAEDTLSAGLVLADEVVDEAQIGHRTHKLKQALLQHSQLLA